MRETTNCLKCSSENIIKKGKAYSVMKGYWTQRYQCKACKYKFTDRVKRIVDPMPFKYKSKPVPATDWSSFNSAQINEKLMFIDLVKELLDLVSVKQAQKTGRPSSEIQDVLFCMLLKIYTMLSSRRLISDLRVAKDMGYINKVPCYSTLMLYFNDKRLTVLLKELVEVAAMPLSQLENNSFAVDSSGFSTSKFGRWFDHKHGEESEKRIYRKAHIICGTLTNIVTSVQLTDQYSADSPQLKHLVKKTALNFEIREVSADKAYISRENLELIVATGAMPYIPFKSNTKKTGGGNGPVWRQMYKFFKEYPQDFFEAYHKRSNVESTFNMIKQKFGDELMTKNAVANFNEILCKILAHNICCLIQSYFEFDVKIGFCTEVQKIKQISFRA